MARALSPEQFERYLANLTRELTASPVDACLASARLVDTRVREHIVRDDLPLTALSDAWIHEKTSQGYRENHLWFTGEYLANFFVVDLARGAEVGTTRPAKGFPTERWQSLAELLEHHYPVWQLTLDEVEPDVQWNYEEAMRAAIEDRKPEYRER